MNTGKTTVLSTACSVTVLRVSIPVFSSARAARRTGSPGHMKALGNSLRHLPSNTRGDLELAGPSLHR